MLPKRLLIKELDEIAYVFVFFGILIVLPQVFQIYSTKSAGDLNILTYGGWALGDIFWLVYAFERRIYPIFIGSSLKFVINGFIIYGILNFGGA